MMMITMMMIIIVIVFFNIIMKVLFHGWRPRCGERAQRDCALKLIAIHLAEIQNLG